MGKQKANLHSEWAKRVEYKKKRKELREGAQFPGHKNYLSLKKNNNKKKQLPKQKLYSIGAEETARTNTTKNNCIRF